MIFALPFLITSLLFWANQLWAQASQHQIDLSSQETRLGGMFVMNLNQCPRLPPRTSLPLSVQNLRPDDIQVVMAIGNSIVAGAFSRGIQSSFLNNFREWRGESYAIGMDPEAITLPNLIKYYNPFLTGGSIGHNDFPEICFVGYTVRALLSHGWNEAVDQLNAAQTGAFVSILMHEVKDYLIHQVKKKGIHDSAWKYITTQIGSNNSCQLCVQSELGISPGSPDDFEAKIRAVLEYMKLHLPNTIVNLSSLFKVSDIYQRTLDEPYCGHILPFVPGPLDLGVL